MLLYFFSLRCYYINPVSNKKHQSLWFDLIILFKTILDTLTLRGRA